MKNKLQKIATVGASFMAALSIVLSLGNPVSAATPPKSALDPQDYIKTITVDGDMKTVSFDFSGLSPLYQVWQYYPGADPNSTADDVLAERLKTNSAINMTILKSGLQRVYSLVNPFGVETYSNAIYDNGVLDVSDIMPGAELTFDCSWEFTLTVYSLDGTVAAPIEDAIQIIRATRILMFDKDFNYIGVVQDYRESSFNDQGVTAAFTIDSEFASTIPSGCAYIAPCFEINLVKFKTDSSRWAYSMRNASFSFSTDINMIYENSQTMQDVKDALGDVNISIQDTNNKLDDVNDNLSQNNEKLDEIISGGDAADDAQGSFDELENGSGAIQDAMDKQHEAESKLPTPPASADDIVSDEVDVAVDEALDNASQLFDWESSGLTNMYVPMGLSVSMSTLFYIIFGKRG